MQIGGIFILKFWQEYAMHLIFALADNNGLRPARPQVMPLVVVKGPTFRKTMIVGRPAVMVVIANIICDMTSHGPWKLAIAALTTHRSVYISRPCLAHSNQTAGALAPAV